MATQHYADAEIGPTFSLIKVVSEVSKASLIKAIFSIGAAFCLILDSTVLQASPDDGINQTQISESALEKIRTAAFIARKYNPYRLPQASNTNLYVASIPDQSMTRRYQGSELMKYVTPYGGNATLSADGSWYFPASSVAPARNGNLSGALPLTPDLQAWGWCIEFTVTNATKLQIRLGSAPLNEAARAVVDGRFVGKKPIPMLRPGSNIYVLELDGGKHVVRFETHRQVSLVSIDVAPAARIARSGSRSGRVTVLATGDSYSEGQGETYVGLDAWPRILGRLMGWSDVRQVAVGGTGYLNSGSGRSRIRDQIRRWFVVNSDLKPADIDVVTLAAGYNDHNYAPADVGAEALKDMRAIRAACPRALIIIFGASAGSRGPDAQTIAIERAIATAVRAWSDTNALFVPISTASKPWIFGTGRIGNEKGVGNSDVLIAADSIHPSDAGHIVYAERAALSIRSFLKLNSAWLM